MLGWNIFSHSIRLVFRNLDAALRISAVPYLVASAIGIYVLSQGGLDAFETDQTAAADLAPGAVGLFFLSSLVNLVAYLWIAVAWHRYVLNEERPTGWVPPLRPRRMIGYFGWSALVVVCSSVVLLGLVLLLAIVPATGLFLLFPVGGAVAIWIFYRLSPVMPAAAIGRPLALREAWSATSGAGGAIAVLVLVTLLVSVVLQAPLLASGDPAAPFAIAYSTLVGWLNLLFGASVLTTFYGHFVEDRPIG